MSTSGKEPRVESRGVGMRVAYFGVKRVDL